MRKFPLFVGAAMLVRSLFFVIQYYYVSTEVDWYGLFMINCLEGIGYLLFITSYTTLVTFFAVLSNVVGGHGDGSFKRQQSHHSLRRQQRYEGTERKNVSQEKNSEDHSPDAHLKTNFMCIAITANVWLFLFEFIFLISLILSQNTAQGMVEMARKIAFSIFYVLYIVQFTRIGIVLRKALQTMLIDSKFLQILVSRVIFACCFSLFLQIISMLSRVALGPTQSFILQHNMTATLFNMSTPSSTQNGIIYVETNDPSKYPKGTILGNRTAQMRTSTAIFTSSSRSFDFGPLVFFVAAEWLPAMYILKVMAPSESVSLICKKRRKRKGISREMTKFVIDKKGIEMVRKQQFKKSSKENFPSKDDSDDEDDVGEETDTANELWV